MPSQKVLFEVISGVEGKCLSIAKNKDCGYRIAGPKPHGGGRVTESWWVNAHELFRELLSIAPDSCQELEQLRSQVSALQAEVEGLRKDKLRMDKLEEILVLYGGLRLHEGNFDCKSHVGLSLTDERDTLRKAIDSLSGGDA